MKVMKTRFRYIRICSICGNTFETNNNELLTCTACKNCSVAPKKKNSSLIAYEN